MSKMNHQADKDAEKIERLQDENARLRIRLEDQQVALNDYIWHYDQCDCAKYWAEIKRLLQINGALQDQIDGLWECINNDAEEIKILTRELAESDAKAGKLEDIDSKQTNEGKR